MKHSKISYIIILICLGVIFLVIVVQRNIKNITIKNNNKIQNSNIGVSGNIINQQRFLTDIEKEKYGIKSEKEVLIKIIPGGKNSIGPLPIIFLPIEEISGSPPSIDSNTDSDNDNITDSDELKIYHTDPNNPDTDGDGHLDGEEVRNGYNPLGEGKLK
ncbi:MAG: hypothetical protein U9M94_03335 [Patescibacteria group bacterium]|nr:hypothetical protein [Patescibacteria group bacterium]